MIEIDKINISSNHNENIKNENIENDIEKHYEKRKYGEIYTIFFDSFDEIISEHNIPIKDIYYNWDLKKYNANEQITTSINFIFLIIPPSENRKKWNLLILEPYMNYQIKELSYCFVHEFGINNKFKLFFQRINTTINEIPTTTVMTTSLGNIASAMMTRIVLNPVTLTGIISSSIVGSITGTIFGFALGPYISSVMFPNKPKVKDILDSINS